MASGKNIYFGKLLGTLIDAISGIAPTLSAATTAQTNALNANLSTMITELRNVKDATAQGVTTLRVKASNTSHKQFFSSVKSSGTVSASSGETVKSFASFRSLADGNIRVTVTGATLTLSGGGASRSAGLFIRHDGVDYAVDTLSDVGSKDVTKTIDIPVRVDGVVEFCLRSYSSSSTVSNSTVSIPENAVSVKYDLLDIVNESPFTPL